MKVKEISFGVRPKRGGWASVLRHLYLLSMVRKIQQDFESLSEEEKKVLAPIFEGIVANK